MYTRGGFASVTVEVVVKATSMMGLLRLSQSEKPENRKERRKMGKRERVRAKERKRQSD